MATYVSYDGAVLAYQELGGGAPLLVIRAGRPATRRTSGTCPASPPRPSASRHPGPGGCGRLAARHDAACHRAGRIAADVAMLVDHLRIAPVDIIAHSAGANVALLLAERRPDRSRGWCSSLPVPVSSGLDAEDADWDAALAQRVGEPWYDALRAALEAEKQTPEQEIESEALFYGRWDDGARAHAASDGPAAQPRRHRIGSTRAPTSPTARGGSRGAGRTRADPSRRARPLAQRPGCRRPCRALPRRICLRAARGRPLPLGRRRTGVREGSQHRAAQLQQRGSAFCRPALPRRNRRRSLPRLTEQHATTGHPAPFIGRECAERQRGSLVEVRGDPARFAGRGTRSASEVRWSRYEETQRGFAWSRYEERQRRASRPGDPARSRWTVGTIPVTTPRDPQDQSHRTHHGPGHRPRNTHQANRQANRQAQGPPPR